MDRPDQASATNQAADRPQRLEQDGEEVAAALDAGRTHQAWALLRRFHPSDAAELLGRLSPARRGAAIEALALRFEPRILPYLDAPIRAEVFARLGLDEAAQAVGKLESDDAVDLLADLAAAERQELLARTPDARRALFEQALAYPPGTAGRLMQLECAIVPAQWTVGQSLDFLQHASELPNWLHAIFVVDAESMPVGQVTLDRLVKARRLERITDVMLADPPIAPALAAEEEVARLFRRYGLISIAVVDASQRIVGQITLDDVLDVIDADEAEADAKRSLAGTDEGDSLAALLVHCRGSLSILAAALPAAALLALFDGTALRRGVVVLAPLAAAAAIGAGRQSLVRSRSWSLEPPEAPRRVAREVAIASCAALPAAAIAGIGGAVLDVWQVAIAAAAAFVAAAALGSMAGVLIDHADTRMKGGVPVNADLVLVAAAGAIGLLLFLGLATWLMP